RPAFHAEFDRLFAFGIDPPPGQLPADSPADWPGLDEVKRYCRRVREQIDRLLPEVPEQLVHVALEHRLMHAETFAYILHQLEYGKKNGERARSTVPSVPPPAHRPVEIPAGAARLGRTAAEGFGWDNEFDAHTVQVPAFAIGKYKITNA